MKMTFKGWKREMIVHEHAVAPVTQHGTRYSADKEGEPLEWNTETQALGKVEGLALNGAFLVEFDFEVAELRDWLMKFAVAQPEVALRLLGAAQAEAMIALANATKEQSLAQAI